jgi:ubiquinone biosynthesis monooxygenase Coq7
METRDFDPLDRLIGEIDKAIKVLTVRRPAVRRPAQTPGSDDLTPSERAQSARLMRINHAGEVAAQALYQGQALTARDARVKVAMQHAAAEEQDHLAWCDQRIGELGGRTSLLNPLWYLGSLSLGALAGVLGDRVSLGFVAETEAQVESHLHDHLQKISAKDLRSRAIIEQMKHEEAQHGQNAAELGGHALPRMVSKAMRAASKLMTRSAYWI